MKTQSWRIGDISVTRIAEQVGPNDLPAAAFFPDLEGARLEPHLNWLVPDHYDPDSDRMITSNHSWLIQDGSRTVLLDSCAGNHKERPWLPRFHQLQTPFIERLNAAGVRPEDVDIVLCTHLHADHIGWNTRLENGRWVPTFPNANYLFSRTENDHWDPERDDRRAKNPARALMYDDSVLPVIQSGQAVLLEGVHRIDTHMVIEPAPGHTIGHVILKLFAGGQGALFCGDVLHHPIQVYEPDWNTRFCEVPDMARTTRRRVLNFCAREKAVLFPTHFAGAHVAAIEGGPKGFSLRFQPAPDAGPCPSGHS